MNNVDSFLFFSNMLLQTSGIFTWTYNAGFELETTNCAIPQLGTYQNRNASLFDLMKGIRDLPDYPVVLSDIVGLMWIFVSDNTDSQEKIHLLGPILPADAPISGINQQLQKIGMEKKHRDDVMQFIQKVPAISLTNIFQYAIMFAYTVSSRVFQLHDIQMLPQDHDSGDVNSERQKNAQGNYAFGSFYIQLVKEGNLQYKELLSNYEVLGSKGKLSNISALRNEQNTGIVTVTLCCWAAMRGGLPPETAYSMSDHYIQAIDAARTVSEVYAYNSAMLDDYIHKVHEHKMLRRDFSKLAADADAYIALHLKDSISIESIAAALGYSKYYFSNAFKKHMGKTVNEYIKTKRLEYAKTQLTASDKDIATLSEELHFISPSYFTKCFREYTGYTPSEFRKKDGRKIP